MRLLSSVVSICFGVQWRDRLVRIFEFKRVLLALLSLERMFEGVCGRSGSTNDTAGDGFDAGVLDDMVDGTCSLYRIIA